MTPTVEHALQIIGLVVVTSWFITLGIAAVLWIREDLRRHRLEKRAEQLFVPEEWAKRKPRLEILDEPATDWSWPDVERTDADGYSRFEEQEW
jgi:hypothetical protein